MFGKARYIGREKGCDREGKIKLHRMIPSIFFSDKPSHLRDFVGSDIADVLHMVHTHSCAFSG